MGSVRANQVLKLGIISCSVNVESARYSEPRVRNACVGAHAVAHDPVALTRPATCATCGLLPHEGFLIKIDKDGNKVDAPVAEAEYSGVINLVPYSQSAVMAATTQGEKAYHLVPKTSPDLYNIISKLVEENPDKAFLCKWAVKTRDSLFIARVSQGVLLLEERVHEDSSKPLPLLDSDYNEDYLQMARNMMPVMEKSFDSKSFKDTYREAVNNTHLAAGDVDVRKLLATLSGNIKKEEVSK